MPFILLVLFSIALLITLVGLFLSPRTAIVDPPEGYRVTARGRRIVDAEPLAQRRRRESEQATQASRQERQGTLKRTRGESGLPSSPIPARASRSTAEVLVPRPVLKPASALSAAPAVSGVLPRRHDIPGLLEHPGSWKIVVPGLCALFLLAMYLFSQVFPHQAIWTSVWFGSNNAAATPTAQAQPATTYDASKVLVRISQLDPAQYASTAEFNTWAYSACSAAAMTEVIDAYGHHYRITDILEVEAKIHEITPAEGLLEESGIAHTGEQFGFKTSWGHTLSLAQVIAAANSGTPVIVSFPPDRFPGGHILVVRGGDSTYVDLADTSDLDMTQMTHTRFMQLWEGFSAIMTPA